MKNNTIAFLMNLLLTVSMPYFVMGDTPPEQESGSKFTPVISLYGGLGFPVLKQPTGRIDIIENGIKTPKEKPIGLGGGSTVGMQIQMIKDSSDIFFGVGAHYMSGPIVRTYQLLDRDQNVEGSSYLDAYNMAVSAHIGYMFPLYQKWGGMLNLGAMMPLRAGMHETRHEKHADFSHTTRLQYTLKRFPGLSAGMELVYDLGESGKVFAGIHVHYIHLYEKTGKITEYLHSDGVTLEEQYPTVSDRETRFHPNISDIRNEPVLYPSTFDSGKAVDALQTNHSLSQAVFQLGVRYHF
jgi:hypothetical protein